MVIAPEGFFLKQLFDRLKSSGIRYAVMRNHEPLPFSAGGSDLDLIVDEADEVAAKALLDISIREVGGTSLGSIQTYGFYKVFALGQNNEEDGAWWGVCIDINFGLFFKGQCLMSSDVAWPISEYRGVAVLKDDFAAILGVLKEILNNGTVPPKYLAAAREGALNNWQQISQLLAPMGSVSLLHLKDLLCSASDREISMVQCNLVRSAFMRHALFAVPSKFIAGRVAYEWSKASRYFSPSGKVIAIHGVDGAGKSTIISAIKPVLDAATHNTVVVQHLRPTLFPPLSRLKGRGAVPKGSVVEPHGQKPSGTVGSLLRLIYLMLDYVVGYWLKTRPTIAKQPTLVIFDRYAYDLAIDPYRFRIALPPSVINWFVKLAPKPDLVICLFGTPEVLAARKQELPLEEVARQIEVIKELVADLKNATLINTEGDLSETQNCVLRNLMRIYK